MDLDVVGRPLAEAETLLRAADIKYTTTVSRPTRDFFKIEEQALYVVRQQLQPDGTFKAETLLLKCPSRYEEEPEEVFAKANQ